MLAFLINVGFFLIFQYLLLLIHELGHVAMARVAGMKVLSVRLGYGRRLTRSDIFGIPIMVNAIPLIGLTMAITQGGGHIRLRYWLYSLGGPATHAIFLAIVYFVSPQSFYPGYFFPKVTSQVAPLESFLFANLLLFVVNVFPRSIKAPIGRFYTDGYTLLTMPFRSAQTIDEILKVEPRFEAYELVRERKYLDALAILERELNNYPGDVFLTHDRALAKLHLGDFRDSRATFLSLIESEEFSIEPNNFLLQNNIAWLDAVIGDEENAERAEKFSRAAFGYAPDLCIFKGTRGSVMVRFGDAAKGSELLESSFKVASDPDSRAAEALFIALARAKQDRFSEADKWLRTAVAESPEYSLTKSIGHEIQSMRSASAGPLDPK